MVLAAGKSTRISTVTGGAPKPLLPLGGEPILLQNLRWLASQGVEEAWVNLHHRGDEIMRVVGDGSRFGLSVRYSHEDPILGTAGAVRKLRDVWTAPFWVVYGDNLVRFSLTDMEEAHARGHFAVTIALFSVETHPFTGIAGGRVTLGASGRIGRFDEGVSGTSPLVNAGVYRVDPAVVDCIPAGCLFDFGRDLFPRLLERGAALGGFVMDGYCLGIDTPEAYNRAQELIESGRVVLQ